MNRQRQHTIPQFYLKRFLCPGWVYRRGESTARAAKSTKGVAVRRGYYGYSKQDKKTLDNLNSMIESEGAPAYNRLIDDPSKITSHDWIILSYLFANLAIRTPVIIEEMRATKLAFYSEVNTIAEKMRIKFNEALANGKDLSPFTNSGLDDQSPRFTLDEVNRAADRLRASNGHTFQAGGLFRILPAIAKCIQKMTFLIVEPPEGDFFLTSDRPLFLQSRVTGSRVGAGWGNEDALGSIPLSPGHFLVMLYYDRPGIYCNTVSSDDVALFNLETIKFAYEEVYSPLKYSEADDWMKELDAGGSECNIID